MLTDTRLKLLPAAVDAPPLDRVIPSRELAGQGMAYTFRMHIHTRTLGFAVDARKELAACLRRVAVQLEQQPIAGECFHPNKILDSTGKDCGRWHIKREME